jgi:hypothetical protein
LYPYIRGIDDLMKHSEKFAPAGAFAAALLSLTCCVPFGITAAVGLAGISMFASRYQGWLIGASVVLLVIGLIQFFRRPACRRRSPASMVLLSLSAGLVVTVVLFPQAIAGFFADHLPFALYDPVEPGALTRLDPASFTGLRNEFNKAAGQVRVIVLLSPT